MCLVKVCWKPAEYSVLKAHADKFQVYTISVHQEQYLVYIATW